MSISIVSRNTICRQGIVQVCIDRGLIVTGSIETTFELNDTTIGKVLLLHITADDIPSAASIANLESSFPGVRIVAFAPHHMGPMLELAYGDHVTAVIPESASSEALISVLVLAEQGYDVRRPVQKSGSNGDVALSKPRSAAKRLGPKTMEMVQGTTPDAVGVQPKLSEREAAVLAHLRAGDSNKTIARALGICDATVKAHLRSSFRRIGAHNRTQAAMWALENL